MDNNLLMNYKKVVKNISYLYKSIGKEFDYQDYKKQAFGIKKVKLSLERKMKNTYDALIYLIENKENELTDSLLQRFMYILYEEEKEDVVRIIKNNYYEVHNEGLIEKMVRIYENIIKIETFNEEERYILSVLLFLYIFYKERGTVLVLYPKIIKEIKSTNKKEELILIFTKLIVSQKKDSKSYYKNLKEISLKEIYKIINKNEKIIKEEYSIKKISVFGSFSKGNERIDSDIDLLVTFEEGLSYYEKKSLSERLKEYLYALIKRRIDILEYNEYVHDDLLEEINKAINILK